MSSSPRQSLNQFESFKPQEVAELDALGDINNGLADDSEKTAFNIQLRREKEKNQLVSIYEITPNNLVGVFREMTLRTLLHQIQFEVNTIDETYLHDFASAKGRQGQDLGHDGSKNTNSYPVDQGEAKVLDVSETALFELTSETMSNHLNVDDHVDQNNTISNQQVSRHDDAKPSTRQRHTQDTAHAPSRGTATGHTAVPPGRQTAAGKSREGSSQGVVGGNNYSSSVLPLRLRDLRRLDFSINNNEELTVQVRVHLLQREYSNRCLPY